MLDIIVLFFLTRYIGEMAIRKGQPTMRWKLYTIGAWFLGGFVGVLIGSLFYQDQLIYLALFFYPCAVAGYHITRTQLNKYPDITSDLDELGSHLIN